MRIRNRDQLAAFHEAGHAVIAVHYRFRLRRVSIEPERSTAGHALVAGRGIVPGTAPRWQVRRYLRRFIRVYMAGGGAAALCGKPSWATLGINGDLQKIDSGLLLLAPWSETEQEAWAALLLTQTAALVKSYRPAIMAVAEELVERHTLTGAEVRRIVQAHPEPPPGADPTAVLLPERAAT